MLKDVAEIKKRTKGRVRSRIRKRLRGTSARPRVYVFKSNRYVYTQVIDDSTGRVLAAASTQEKDFREKNPKPKNREACERLGEILVQRLKSKNIDKVVFDRGVYPYHGRIKVLADAMRKKGLVF